MAVTWTEDQKRVIESRNRNLLVSAAAGSGKTAVLVERIIRMISEGEHPLDIDKLLVMTFTNAAASEMRERIGAAVDKKLREQPENEHLWLQAALIPQAQITTIDSFCLNIIRNHYNTLDIDPAFRVGDEGELALLQGDVMGQMLEECYEEGTEAFCSFVEQFGRGRSDKGIEEVIFKTWQFSQSHPWPRQWIESCRAELQSEDIGQIEHSAWMQFLLKDTARQMEELASQLEGALEVCREENGPLAYEPMLMNDIRKIEKIGAAAAEGDYEALYAALEGMTFERLASIRSKEIDPDKKAFAGACRDRAKKALSKCREIFASQSPREIAEGIRGTREPLGTLFDLTVRFDEAYRQAKRERNILDFNDMEHLALEVLLEPVQQEAAGSEQEGTGARQTVSRLPSAVADELSRQYEEILVDEYQDSNYVQEALISSISRERFGRPNVFMVGDVKQSIYRFRLARPELFLEKYEKYPREEGPYQMIELRRNFRSRDTVLRSINDIFYQIMTKNLGGIRYTQETALYPGAVFPQTEETADSGSAGTPTELLLLDTGAESLKQLDEDTLDYTARELEARMIAARIRRLTGEKEGLLIWDGSLGESGGYRRAGYGDIVILLRSMSGWSEVFVNILMNEGIPAIAQTRTGYFNTVEVETMLSLLSIIDNPMQDIPLAAVLRSPVIGMTDEEMAWMMAAYKRNTGKNQDRGVYGAWKLWQEGDPVSGRKNGDTVIPKQAAGSIKEKLDKLKRLLSGLRLQSRHLPVHELLYRVYRESGYYDYVSAMPAGETRRANLDMLVEKAAAYEATSYKGLFHFVRYIERLKKFDTDYGEAQAGGSQEKAVRIMSIHKSKGLEFPVVFLAGMGKRFNKQDAYSQILLDADLGAAADFMDLELRVKAPTLKKQALKRKMELETVGEELRILYVAMTRAKEKLIMTASDRSLESKLEKWKDIPLTDGQLPFTVLSGASSYLDWLLMAEAAIPAGHLTVNQADIRSLIGQEVSRQMGRKMAREDLLNLDEKQIYDVSVKTQLEEAMGFRYPYESDKELYAMMSVSELKKQSQIGRPEEDFDTGRGLAGGALRGTAYHRALELLEFSAQNSFSDVKQSLLSLYEQGYLDREAYEFLYPAVIWKFLKGPVGQRMASAEKAGRLHREQQFILGIPAKEMARGESGELVLIQGIIDAYIEEEDGLVLIDYKTDWLPGEDPEKEAAVLAERYRTQLDYYSRALAQLTGKQVKERFIYSLSLQRSVPV
ncbi:MAG: helicase-exonuclease AddAB subunit AddA [Enterocloster sp.]